MARGKAALQRTAPYGAQGKLKIIDSPRANCHVAALERLKTRQHGNRGPRERPYGAPLSTPDNRRSVKPGLAGVGVELRFLLKIEASEARQAEGKRRKGSLWADVGNGFFVVQGCP